jgi:hypothetical protein
MALLAAFLVLALMIAPIASATAIGLTQSID